MLSLFAAGIPHFILEVAILLCPLIEVYRLHISAARKIAVAAMFASGLLWASLHDVIHILLTRSKGLRLSARHHHSYYRTRKKARPRPHIRWYRRPDMGSLRRELGILCKLVICAESHYQNKLLNPFTSIPSSPPSHPPLLQRHVHLSKTKRQIRRSQ
jgi:hypothetical protein